MVKGLASGVLGSVEKNIGDSSSLLGEHSIALLHYYHAFFVCFLNLEGEEGGGEMRRLGGTGGIENGQVLFLGGRRQGSKQTGRQARRYPFLFSSLL